MTPQEIQQAQQNSPAAVAQVKAGGVLDPGQDAHHPRFAEDTTAAEHEHVWP